MSVDYRRRNLWKKAMAFLMTSVLTIGTVSVPALGGAEDEMPVAEAAETKADEITQEPPKAEAAEDVQSPIVISESSVSVDKASANDEITYRIKIDGTAESDEVSLSVRYTEADQMSRIYLTPQDGGFYTGTITVSPYNGNGTLSVYDIEIWNGSGYETYYNTKLADEQETQKINMDALDVELSGCGLDVDAPVIDWAKCSITPEVLDGAGEITLSVPVSDDGSGIPEQCGEIGFYNEEADIVTGFEMHYDEETGLAVGVRRFSAYGANGTWTMNHINIYDNAGNYASAPQEMPGFETKNLEEDFDLPIIDWKNVRMEPAELRPHETVTITIPAEDKSGIREAQCYMGLEGILESEHYVDLRYDEEQKVLIGEFILDRDYGKNGQKYVLKSLWCEDGAENAFWSSESDLAECPAFVTTRGFIEDSAAPEIDISTLNIDPIHVTPNTEQEISVKVTDVCGEGEKVSGINYVECVREFPDGRTESLFLYKSLGESDIYSITRNYNSYGINGRYVIKKVIAYDHAGNIAESVPTNAYYDVEGLTEDEEPPKADLKTLTIMPKEAGPYSQIQVQVKATDNKVVDHGTVTFIRPDGVTESYRMEYDPETELVTSSLVLGNYEKNGIWKLRSLSLTDEAGNNTFYWADDLEKEYTVVVSGMKEDKTAPLVDLSQIKFSKEIIHPGDTLRVEIPVVEESDIEYSLIRLTSGENGRNYIINLYPVGSGENKVLVGAMHFNDENVRDNGRWSISEISVSDSRGNTCQETPEEMFLTFEGFGDKFEKIKIFYDQITMNKTLVKPGDVLQITIPVANVEALYGNCTFKRKSGERISIYMFLNEDKTALSGELEMRGVYGYNTDWELEEIFLHDGTYYIEETTVKNVSFTTEGFREQEDEIDYAGITITPVKVQKKQKVSVRIPLKNPDNVESGDIWIAVKGKEVVAKRALLEKNNNVLEGFFEFNGYEEDTEWKISSLSYNVFRMGTTNYCSVNIKKHPELKNMVLTTENMNTDQTAPVLDFGSIKLQSKTVLPGGKAELTLKASDNLSGISRVIVNYEHIGKTTTYEMEKKGKDVYSLTIPLSTYGYDGIYRLSSVTLSDYADNFIRYENDKYDLSGGDFEVSNFKLDYEAPLFDRAGWKFDKRVYNSDEEITFSIPVSDRESGISSIQSYILIGNQYEKVVEMKYNEKTGLAECRIDNFFELMGDDLLETEAPVKCVVDHIKVTDKAENISYIGIQVPFTVNMEHSAFLPFNDISPEDWFAKEVRYVYKKKLMTGLNDTTFAPYGILSRAQFAVILHRMAGSPKVVFDEKRFPDVEKGWYSDAVIWANDQGIINGYTHNGCFGPADNITREQMATMMHRYAEKMGYDISASADFGGFEDSYKVSGFAEKSMRWAVGSSIITGKYNGTILDPQGEASRAECAIILQRFLEM